LHDMKGVQPKNGLKTKLAPRRDHSCITALCGDAQRMDARVAGPLPTPNQAPTLQEWRHSRTALATHVRQLRAGKRHRIDFR